MRSITTQARILRSERGVEVNVASVEAAIDAVMQRVAAGQGGTLFTVNLDHMVKMRADHDFRDAYLRATLVLADGWPIVWLLRRQGERLHRATGADLIEPLLARAAELGLRAYFIGPGERSLSRALTALRERHAALRIVGADSGRIEMDAIEAAAEDYAKRLRRAHARICVLSLGAPKQERLAEALRRRCPGVAFICVGAALDFISGEARRAPRLVQRVGLEWLWRMSGDPARLWARYAACLTLFVELALRSALAGDPCGLRGRLSEGVDA